MNTYQELTQSLQDSLSAFEGVFYAFSNEQFAEGMAKVGLEATDTDNIRRFGAGCFIREDRLEAYKDLFRAHNAKMAEFLSDKENLTQALAYELSNHEYGYTGDASPAIEALGLNPDDIPAEVCSAAIQSLKEAA